MQEQVIVLEQDLVPRALGKLQNISERIITQIMTPSLLKINKLQMREILHVTHLILMKPLIKFKKVPLNY